MDLSWISNKLGYVIIILLLRMLFPSLVFMNYVIKLILAEHIYYKIVIKIYV